MNLNKFFKSRTREGITCAIALQNYENGKAKKLGGINLIVACFVNEYGLHIYNVIRDI